MLIIIVSGLIIYGICWALHAFSNYLDFEAPSKAEAKYKKNITEKCQNVNNRFNRLINISDKSLDMLYKKAEAYAQGCIANIDTNSMPAKQIKELKQTYYSYYVDKHKLLYS